MIKESEKIIWKPIRIKLSQIRPWTKNPRYSTKAQAERLIQSENEFGQLQTLAISPFDENGIADLYDGHQRYMAWMTAKGGDFEIWALQANRYLTDEERRKVSILLHAGTVGAWNWDELCNWDTNLLKQAGMDEEYFRRLGKDYWGISSMLAAENKINYDELWAGMPEFKQDGFENIKIIVHFANETYRDEFAKKLGIKITDKTRSIWYPQRPEELSDQSGTKMGLAFVSESEDES
jgi:hypothetical protein